MVILPVTARAEFGPWAPINPNFIGGNAFNGTYLLEKAKATNEYQEDIAKKIEQMMNRLMDQLERMTDEITGSIENLNFNFDFNYIIQSGTGNTAIISPGSGILSGFSPTWGME
ncbi:MAG: curli assembly protein CsgF [Candidatus Nanoarchaeia archaeon]